MATIDEEQFTILTPAFIFVAILVVLGIPGNIISICVYKLQLKSTIGRDAIIMLAVCDVINCVMSIPVELYIMTRYYTFENGALCKMSRYVTYSMNNASGLILIAIAFERFRTICRPHKPKINKTHVRLACAVMVILGPVLALPSLWIYGIQTDLMYEHGSIVYTHLNAVHNSYSDYFQNVNISAFESNYSSFQMFAVGQTLRNVTLTKRCLIDDSVRNTWFSYSFFGFLTVASSIVMIILVFVYSQIALKIKSLRTLASTPSELSRERSATKKKHATFMLFLITLAFQFSFIPFIIISNIRFFTAPGWYNEQGIIGKMVYHFFLRSYLFNCAVNPFIYCISSPRFRAAVCKLHMKMKGKQAVCMCTPCGMEVNR